MRVIDSHTEGEPTRVIVEGGPELGSGSMAQRMRRFAELADADRRALVCEPRGSQVHVGAILCDPVDSQCAAGVIFFNTAGFLGMCGHGVMGVAVTLAHLGRITPGHHRLETPVGTVRFELRGSHEVSVVNVPSFRHRADVPLTTPILGPVTGDIAWGGNWFFLVEQSAIELSQSNIPELTRAASELKRLLAETGLTGDQGALIDHIEFTSPSPTPNVNSRNFVHCPSGAYDRSPCGTGTSAKLACLAADGKLPPGHTWVQESIIGSRFTASYQPEATSGGIVPTISGRAFICAEVDLIRQPGDPFANGIP